MTVWLYQMWEEIAKDKLCHFKLPKLETWTKGISVIDMSHNLQIHHLKKNLSLPGSDSSASFKQFPSQP